MRRSIIMDKAHEKMWSDTKDHYTKLLATDISEDEKSWYERRIASCENLLTVFKVS